MLYKWIPIQSTKHKWSPKTYTQSVAMVQNLIVPYIGKRKVQELRTYDIEKFYATLAKTPCGQYVHGVKQNLSEKQKKRLLSSTSIHEVHTLLKTAFSYAVEWDLIHKIPLPRDAPKVNIEERTIWDEKTMLAALQTIENPALHLAVHMSMILSLREGEILGLQPSDLDFDAADGRGTISVYGGQSTRSLSKSCSTVCDIPVPPTSSCSRMAISSRCRATQATQRHPS